MASMSVSSSIRLLTCNIEGRKHFERLIPFIKQQHPDVVCMQEVFQCDLDYLEKQLGMRAMFTPILDSDFKNIFDIDPLGYWGIAIFTHLPIVEQKEYYYVGSRAEIPKVDESNSNSLNRAVRWADIVYNNAVFRIATTHFTWSPNGEYIPLQGENLALLEHYLRSELGEFVICGDFNSPRGGEIYQRLTAWLQDAVPPDVTTTIDKDWHRAGDLQFVVDYLFHTPHYQIKQVKTHNGISDHMALTGQIEKNDPAGARGGIVQ